MISVTETGRDPQSILSSLRTKWAWFVALGAALLILGLIAFGNQLAATIASVMIVGVLMLVGGVAQIIHAFPFRSWGSFLYWLLSGLLYAVAGLIALYNPVLGAVALTLVLALMLLASGILRVVVGTRLRPERGWGWVVASGVMTVLVGIIVAVGWPVNAVWVLGLFLAIDLFFQGLALLVFGFDLRSSSAGPRPAPAA